MLFGEEFAKQVKAIKKLSIPLEKKGHFSGYHPRSYQSSHGGGAKSDRTRYQLYYKGTGQAGQSNRPGQNSSQDQRN